MEKEEKVKTNLKEEIQEKIDEKMAMREYTFKQEQKPQQSTVREAAAQNWQKERDDAFRAMFAGESCFFW